MRLLVACEFSGIVREAFRAKGHDAWSCDILPSDQPTLFHYKGDVLDILNDGWDMMIAHPPCTHLAVSGARWFTEGKKDWQLQIEALKFVELLMLAPIEKIVIENPVSVISTKIRKPDQIIQPWQFGHPETKKTCLWLKNLPKLKSTKIVEPDYMRNKDGTYYMDKKGKRYSRIHFMSYKNSQRSKERSLTYKGIALAMADQWG
jgi:site-specific DNA-cytosine methylase